MSEGDFLWYANEEAYEMRMEKPEEFAEHRMKEYDYRLTLLVHIQNPSFGITCSTRVRWLGNNFGNYRGCLLDPADAFTQYVK